MLFVGTKIGSQFVPGTYISAHPSDLTLSLPHHSIRTRVVQHVHAKAAGAPQPGSKGGIQAKVLHGCALDKSMRHVRSSRPAIVEEKNRAWVGRVVFSRDGSVTKPSHLTQIIGARFVIQICHGRYCRFVDFLVCFDLAHVAAWDAFNNHDAGQVPRVGSVLHKILHNI